MNRLSREQFVSSRFWGIWSLLGFQAGFVNAFGFLACGRYVSHVTGVGTQLGVSIGAQNWVLMAELVGFPLSFIAGSFFNSLFTVARIEKGKKPAFRTIALILPIGFTIVLLTGLSGQFGAFDAQTLASHEVNLLYALSFLCGLQNGCFATLTHGQIRTTHLTGISTDIGTDLARLWFGRVPAEDLKATRQMNICRALTAAAFTFGSVASVLLCASMEFAAMMIPALTSIIVFFVVSREPKTVADKSDAIIAEVQGQSKISTETARAN